MKKLTIDVVSDISCVWCAVGLFSINKALQEFPDVEAEYRFHPFELNPFMPPEGQNLIEHLHSKYGIPEKKIFASFEELIERGNEVGFVFNFSEKSRIYNTFDTHRFMHWVKITAPQKQKDMEQALFIAHFTNGKNPADHNLLAELAATHGLDRAEAQRVLETGEYSTDVTEEKKKWLDQGVRMVPTMILQDGFGITGCQSVSGFALSIENALEGERLAQMHKL